MVILCVAPGLLALAHPGAGAPPSGLPDEAQLIHSYGRLSLAFEANLGQVAEPEVKFLSRGRGSTLFLKAGEAVLVLAEFDPRNSELETRSGLKSLLLHNRFLRTREARLARRDRTLTVLRMKLLGASPQPQVSGLDELPGKSNYFLGNDPAHWVTNVTRYAKVRYQDVYPGVDLVYYGRERQLEYDFVVSPGGDPGAIKLAIRAGQGAAPLH